jgi:hypothetical protein
MRAAFCCPTLQSLFRRYFRRVATIQSDMILKMRTLAAALILLVVPGFNLRAQAAADTSTAQARKAFDFLIGSWRVATYEDSTGVRASTGETYTFEKALNGVMISSRWHFNRGSPEKPDFTDAVYYSGYDNTSRIWNFYYVSPRSAQYWPGELREGRWYFFNRFVVERKPLLQRQWWESVDSATVRRHIDNSWDNGVSWTPFIITLKRTRE